MSDAIDWVVDTRATLEEAPALARKALSWLVEQGIVHDTPKPERTSLSRRPLYPPDRKASDWSVEVTETLHYCGLEIVTERTVFHTGDNGLDALKCPHCQTVHELDVIEWGDAVQAWLRRENDALTCPACGAASPVTRWIFTVEGSDGWSFDFDWGFGNLGFGFCNWMIEPKLVQQIGRVLGHEVKLVHEHI